MITTSLVTKAVLGTAVACSGLTGAAQAKDVVKTTTVKVEAKAPVKTVQVKKLVIVKSQDDCKKIALKHCAGTIKKVEKSGHIYIITILGTDHHEHVYQVNEQTGNCAGK